MSEAQLDRLLSWLRERLEDLYGDRLAQLVLFGSHARGEAQEEADVDVAVVLRDDVDAPEEIERTAVIVADAVLEFGRFVSVYPVSKADYEAGARAIIRSVRREGIPA